MSKELSDSNNSPDKRIQPRYKTNFAAEITTSSGEVLNAVVTNISLSGLQLEGDDELPFKLFVDRHQDEHSGRAFFKVHFTVPTSLRTQVDIDIECQSVYIRRISKQAAIAGCQFHHFDHQCENDLADYIANFGELL